MTSYFKCAALLAILGSLAAPVHANDAQLAARFDTCKVPPYPDTSATGISVIGLLVGGDGVVVDTVVLSSSGTDALDRAAAAGLAKCAFRRPDTIDKAVALWADITYVWSFADDGPRLAWAKRVATRAAEKGDAAAAYHLSLLISTTATGNSDRARAMVALRSAAESGHPRAQFDLARRFEIGYGVEQNLEAALRWYQKSADSGDPLAKQRLTLGLQLDRSRT